MIGKITLLTSYLFALIYPLCFWISIKDPLKSHFLRFHLGTPAIVAALITSYGVYSNAIPNVFVLIWCFSLLAITAYYWNKDTPNPLIVTFISLIGLIGYLQIQSLLISGGFAMTVSALLSGLVFSSSLYAMNLGHWYLNVHGLPVIHLINATRVFACSLILRLIWNIYQCLTVKLEYNWEMIPLYQFLTKMDGLFLVVAILFGTIFPLVSCYFVFEVLKLKNTQSATGILYVILCGVLLGDLAYKYFWIVYGLYL